MPKWLTPSRLVLASFALFIILGAALLAMPLMQGHGEVGLLDCLFTATSAVCVTGLITVDTATAWSPWGQGLILVMLQAGGLGIMT
ncbi:MAG: TrkH family potassium uptake protein, partial [Proteobacteria bacterium]|nr:TrkH family potassium uptake protein [Pseudomonadota bacterium]